VTEQTELSNVIFALPPRVTLAVQSVRLPSWPVMRTPVAVRVTAKDCVAVTMHVTARLPFSVCACAIAPAACGGLVAQ
jgi:hypothetical protein